MKEEFDNKSTIYKIHVNVEMILSLLIIVIFFLDIYIFY